jgi:hypothetical protein
MPKKHALLSPSGAKRWLTCTPSAQLESKLPDRATSYADEGTFAHWLSIDVILAYRLGRISEKNYNTEISIAKTRKYYSISLHEYCKDFASYVIEQYNRARAIDKHTAIFLETEIDLSMFIPEGFGTADVIIICEGLLILIDLKYGQGVPVDAEDNDQLKVYGSGALEKFKPLFDVDVLELHIYQPRIGNISSWKISANSLTNWVNEVLIPGAIAAYNGHGDYEPGEHCKFCRARLQCHALSAWVLSSYEPGQIPGTISAKKVSEILQKQAVIKSWLSSITEWALEEALQKGRKWPGFKLVEGTSRRQIKDENGALKILQGLKLAKSEYTRTELLPIGQLEDLVGGQKNFNKLFESVIHKPKGAPTLVPVSDKRTELNSIQSAFDHLDIETE